MILRDAVQTHVGCEADAASFVEDAQHFTFATGGQDPDVLPGFLRCSSSAAVAWGPRALPATGSWHTEAAFSVAEHERCAVNTVSVTRAPKCLKDDVCTATRFATLVICAIGCAGG